MAAHKDQRIAPEELARIFDCAKRVTPRAGYTGVKAAKEAGCTIDTMSMARTVLERGTAEEILAASTGAVALHTLAKAIRRGVPAEGRIEKLNEKDAARLERQREEAALYQTLKDALLKLTGLPRASDVAEATRRQHKRNTDVERCLPIAIQWLKEFEHEFRSKAA